MRTITCMWAVPWKGGGTAARLKGEGLGTDHATWLIGRRCVACSRTLLGPCVASSSLGMLYGSRGALGPSWGRAWQHREVPSPVRAYPCFVCRRTTGACTDDEGAVRVQGRRDGDPVLGVRMRRVDARRAWAPPFTLEKRGARVCARGTQPRRDWPQADGLELLIKSSFCIRQCDANGCRCGAGDSGRYSVAMEIAPSIQCGH